MENTDTRQKTAGITKKIKEIDPTTTPTKIPTKTPTKTPTTTTTEILIIQIQKSDVGIATSLDIPRKNAEKEKEICRGITTI